MLTWPLQSPGPERTVELQQVLIHAPQPPAAVAAVAAGAIGLPAGRSPGATFVGGLITVVTDGDGSVWSCGFFAAAAGTTARANRRTKRTFRMVLTPSRVAPHPGATLAARRRGSKMALSAVCRGHDYEGLSRGLAKLVAVFDVLVIGSGASGLAAAY